LSSPVPGSSQAIDPPPAPIEATSITGRTVWYLPNTGVPVITGSPSTTRPTSKLVPPTSVVTMFGVPISWPSAAAPITPPAGPEASSDTARSLASSAEVTPPEECMIVSSLGRPPSRSFSWRAVM